MSRTAEHKQRINVRATQMEMTPRGSVGGSSPLTEDFSGKLIEAQSQLEMLQQQQQEVERQKLELQELNEAKDDFLHGQVDLHEKLSTAVTAMCDVVVKDIGSRPRKFATRMNTNRVMM